VQPSAPIITEPLCQRYGRQPSAHAALVGPVLPNVSPAANWAVVPGQRRAGGNSRDWSYRGPALKYNVLTCGDALPCG